MLYDQALLARVYLHALAGDRRAARTARSSTRRSSTCCATCATPTGASPRPRTPTRPTRDGHSDEGLFHMWTPSEIGDVARRRRSPTPRSTGTASPTRATSRAARSCTARSAATCCGRPTIEEARALAVRRPRATGARPGLDDKVLTEWNAPDAGGARRGGARPPDARTGSTRPWRTPSSCCARLRRRRRALAAVVAGRRRGPPRLALAADHAALVDAFTRLAEATGEARWIAEAAAHAPTRCSTRFWDAGAGGAVHHRRRRRGSVVRQKDLLDNATPSANSPGGASPSYRLAALTGEQRYHHHADQILALVGGLAAQYPTSFAYAFSAIDTNRAGLTEIAVAGSRPDLVRTVVARYLPNAVLAWGEPFASPLWDGRVEGHAYVCRDFVCLACNRIGGSRRPNLVLSCHTERAANVWQPLERNPP